MSASTTTLPAIPDGGGSTSKKWVAAATVIGTTIEWYDFFIFGTASALVFNKLFFPSFDPFTGTLASFGTFAVGLFARPFGGLIFGHFGDRIGRKSMLLLSLFLMGVPTILIGLLPTYDTLGIWAAILLILLRILQGVAVGGEWGGAVLMAVEHAGDRERSLFGSLPQIGTPAGLICATLAFSYASSLSEDDFLTWGWRVPFLISIVLIALGVFVRAKVSESPAFLAAKAEGHTVEMPGVEIFAKHKRSLFLAVGAKLAEVTLFYLVTVFILQYATTKLGIPRSEVLNSILMAAGLGLFTIPLFGYLGDRFGLRLVYGIGAILLALAAVPLFWILDTGDTSLIRFGIIVCLGGIYPMMYGPQPALYSSQFPASIRYSGISLCVQGAAAIGGGLAPIIATSLLSATEGTTAVGLYLGALGLLAATCCGLLRSPATDEISSR
ncbi:MFS transporter [Methylobacterium bullatum]|uniref:Inner membrane metabolite transport protein YhjE n=1 Tax=Methylobacterium bullatum TaxID=570505 RepID=A0A679K0G0_9HYPH|nr:Inner membrane metabolite transport protein YhjE [Methylobacterium bullatum]